MSPRIEIIDIKITDDVVKMVMIEDVVVKKKKSELFFTTWRKHLMLFEITKKLNDGDSFDLQVNLKMGMNLILKLWF